MSIGQRFDNLIKKMNLNITSFSKEIGLSQSSIRNIVDEVNQPSAKVLVPIVERYPYVNLNWLLVGTGEMFFEDIDSSGKKIITGDGNNVEIGNNTTNSNNKNSNNVSSEVEKIKSLEKEIEMLRKTIADKDKIIELLETRK